MINAAIVIQCFFRSYKAKKICVSKAQQIIEKIYDPKTSSYYYYNKRLHSSRWSIPLFLHYANEDIFTISPTYTREEAIILIQSCMRRRISQKHVRYILASNYEKIWNYNTKTFNYHDKESGKIIHKKSRLWGSEDISDYYEDKNGIENQCENEENASVIAAKKARKHPRSKMQKLVDQAEDTRPKKDISLHLSNLGAHRISDRVFKLESSVITLDLSGNNLLSLSPKIRMLQSLTILNLSKNMLKEIPRELVDLINLEELYLSHNKLVNYPIEIYFKLVRLRRWDISHNKILEVRVESNQTLLNETGNWDASMGLMKQLEVFETRKNKISKMPHGLENCNALIRIDLSCNKISCIPDGIGHLYNLQYINFSDNRIKSIPKTCKLWSNIEEINLEKNTIECFPSKELTYGWRNSLQYMNLGCNKIREVPDSIRYLTKAKVFICKKNNISMVSDLISKAIELKELDLSYNQLIDLPVAIFNCKRLKKVNLDSNRLRRIPSGVCHLFYLEELSIKSNELETLGGIGSLVSLNFLDASCNRLNKLPTELYQRDTLSHLILSNNGIDHLSDKISNLKNLEKIDLSFNRLRTFPLELQDLEALKYILLNNNQATEYPFNLTSFKSGVALDVSGNHFKQSLLKNDSELFTKPLTLLLNLKSNHDEFILIESANLIQTSVDEYNSNEKSDSLRSTHNIMYYNPYFCLAIAQIRVANWYLCCHNKQNATKSKISLRKNLANSLSDINKRKINDDCNSNDKNKCEYNEDKSLSWFLKAKESLDQSEELFQQFNSGNQLNKMGGNIYFTRALCHLKIGELTLCNDPELGKCSCNHYFKRSLEDIDQALEMYPLQHHSLKLKLRINLKLGKYQQVMQEHHHVSQYIDSANGSSMRKFGTSAKLLEKDDVEAIDFFNSKMEETFDIFARCSIMRQLDLKSF